MSEKEKRRKLGRPPKKPKDRRLPSMSFRPTHDLRDMLEKAADKSGRSLSQEIEYRLWRSEMDEDARQAELYHEFGGVHCYALAKVIARMAGLLGDLAWTRWSRDPEVFREFRKALDVFFDGIVPPQATNRKPSDTFKLLKKLIDDGHGTDPGIAVGQHWLEQIAEAQGRDRPAEVKGSKVAMDLRVAYEVAPELAPLIHRKD